MREGLWERYEKLFRAFGWDVVILKHGSLQQAAFAEPGGARLRDWIDSCPNQLYSALVFQGGAAWRKRLMDDLGDQGDVTRLIEARSDEELARLMTILAGHDLPSLIEAFGKVDHDRPICFICYTIKGFGLPFAGHKDNHAGLMTPAQTESLRAASSEVCRPSSLSNAPKPVWVDISGAIVTASSAGTANCGTRACSRARAPNGTRSR